MTANSKDGIFVVFMLAVDIIGIESLGKWTIIEVSFLPFVVAIIL